jgi:hypothetical protein
MIHGVLAFLFNIAVLAPPQYQPAKIYLVSSSSIRYRVPSQLLEPFATSAIRALCAQCQIRAALISSTAPSSPAR